MGRPAFEPSDEQRANVRLWVQGKVSIQEMARRLELTPKTFRKHFATELGLGPVETVITETVAVPGGPGRREAFKPTTEQRQSVLIMAGAHGDYDRMARALGISVDLLLEHFAKELEDGDAVGWRKLAEAAYYGMLAGSASHLKVWSILNMQQAKEDATVAQPAALGMLGKKAAANLGAPNAHAGTPWEDIVPGGSKPN